MGEIHLDESTQRFGRREPELEQVAEVRGVEVGLGCGEGPHVVAGGLDIRPGEHTPLDQLAETHILEVRTAGAAHSRHAALECRPHGRRVSDVYVRVDQPRHDVAAGHVDAPGNRFGG